MIKIVESKFSIAKKKCSCRELPKERNNTPKNLWKKKEMKSDEEKEI